SPAASESVLLDCTVARIGGALFLSQVEQLGSCRPRFSCNGQVSLNHAKIGLTLQCQGAKIINKNEVALNCSAIVVGSGVFLTRSAEPTGSTDNANVTEEMRTNWKAQWEENRAAFESDGEVTFSGAQIGKSLSCEGAHLRNVAPDKQVISQARRALAVTNARIGETLVLGRDTTDGVHATIEGSISLEHTHVGALIDNEFVANDRAFPEQVDVVHKKHTSDRTGETINGLPAKNPPLPIVPGQSQNRITATKLTSVLALDGFVYDRFGGDSPTDAATRIDWLNRQPKKHLSKESFRPQPF